MTKPEDMDSTANPDPVSRAWHRLQREVLKFKEYMDQRQFAGPVSNIQTYLETQAGDILEFAADLENEVTKAGECNCKSRNWPSSESFHEDVEFPNTTILEEGYLIRRAATEHRPIQMVTRPTRGTGNSIVLWGDRARAERECDEGEEVVHVRLRMEIVE